VEREIILMRDGAVVRRGLVRPAVKAGVPASAHDYFQEAWRQALAAGAVQLSDAASVQFR
jgi:hypothetical protein